MVEKKEEKKSKLVVMVVFLTLMISLISLAMGMSLLRWANQLEQEMALPHVVTEDNTMAGYEEVCYNSSIENRKKIVLAKIDHKCIESKINSCDSELTKCGNTCIVNMRHNYSYCKNICFENYQKCVANGSILKGLDDCIEPPYTQNFTVETCDEWIMVKKGGEVKEGEEERCNHEYYVCKDVCWDSFVVNGEDGENTLNKLNNYSYCKDRCVKNLNCDSILLQNLRGKIGVSEPKVEGGK